MTEIGLREFHSFEASGREFLYLVPSAAVFELDAAASAVITRLRQSAMPPNQLMDDEIWQIVNYLRTLKQPIAEQQELRRAVHRLAESDELDRIAHRRDHLIQGCIE